jgi:NAD(P)-dependent dehydrogenase (short-subunit alcohol dehydrogenase family)
MRLDKTKVCLVVGGGGAGSGRAIAGKLAEAGATVIVADIDEAGARETARQIEEKGGRAAPVRCDVTISADVKNLFEYIKHSLGGLDVLVNDASASPTAEGPLDGWFEQVDVDFLGTLRTILVAIPLMATRGSGAIINLASTSALPHGRLRVRWPAYDAAKAGVIRLTTALASLRESHQIRVNCIVPAWIGSPHVRSFYDALNAERRREIGAPDSLIEPAEIATAVMGLITDESLAGRLLVLKNGEPPQLIPFGDPGFGG